MKLIDLKKLQELQSSPESVRNICILAHVDHGKTTLADSLVASNGIISNKLAGKLRYLDSRPDEQLRGITMKSSSITLYHRHNQSEYIVNLIDSPGHIDFSSEVSTAVRLCDGALIVVDVVEGVCPQTRSAISIAYTEGLEPILVFNKIDRLITEMKLSPLDAYVHLNQVLEQVNAVMGEIYTSELMKLDCESGDKEEEKNKKETEATSENQNTIVKDLADWQSVLEEMDDSSLYFSPEKNVLFTSAIDGWGFSIKDFAKIYSEKLGFSEKALSKTLWGDYYLNTKLKRIMKGAEAKAKKPLGVQLILENLWTLYETVMRRDKEKVESMVNKMNIKLTTRDLRHTDPKAQLHAICSQWLPLARACLGMTCDKVPSPHKLSNEKVERLISGLNDFSSMPEETKKLKQAFLDCKADENAPIIIFISKMFPVDNQSLPENKPKPFTPEELAQRREIARQRHAEKMEKDRSDEMTPLDVEILNKNENSEESVDNEVKKEEEICQNSLIAFARIYSGTVSVGTELYVLGPKHNPKVALEENGEKKHIEKVKITKLYTLMGRDLEATDKAMAGNVIGIGDLEKYVSKTATLSSTIACPSFSELTALAVPIYRVALEPKNTQDLQKLRHGLKLLSQADACAVVHTQETGEIILTTAGEVHLERCLEDLKLRYAKIEINVSEPIVSLKETIVPPPKTDMVNEVIEKKEEEELDLETSIWNNQCKFEIDAKPLPDEITKFLENNAECIKKLDEYFNNLVKIKENNDIGDLGLSSLSLESNEVDVKIQTILKKFIADLSSAFKEAGWEDYILEKIWSFGPRKCGPNILVNESSFNRNPFWQRDKKSADVREMYINSMIHGFQNATLNGPLCEEPMTGVCFVIKEWEIVEKSQSETITQNPQNFGGQLMSACQRACRKAFRSRRPRLVTPMLSCSVMVNSDVLGKLYAVFNKRHGRVIETESSGFGSVYRVLVVLPMAESFDLASELRKQSSGLAATPQLSFSHWEVIEQDPFWVPSTEEEYLHFGEKADSGNRAKMYMDAVRRRKGLPVDSQLVTHAEKQRTLSKKK